MAPFVKTSTNNGVQPVAPNYPVDSTDTNLHNLQFSLTHNLQKTLDIDTMLELFFDAIQDSVKVSAISFETDDLLVNLGQKQKHTASYRIATGNHQLGTLLLSRNKRFMEVELAILEMLIGILFFPLRNGMLYRQALEKSMRDSLTGIGNRMAMNCAFEREFKLARRHKQPLSILVLDIDHFKQINDNHGHRCGDKVLQHVCQTMQSTLRETDLMFRFGGEEFTILLNNTNSKSAKIIGDRIRLNVASSPTHFESRDISVTLSVGASSLEWDDTEESLFERADQALYQAKRGGRNKVEFSAAAPPGAQLVSRLG